ncbi:group III truncated hemoglobin [Brevundimonas terrae]|uniref:Group III truncated hemoglobin n=1 Tax=Brevundimonas terrae TaxID=363631 RepID=A0ABN0YFK4_9CAUL|nr:group III truncated hemoglobin [Brevundimonas terrae]NIJ26810.1 hemoglobin [Brevundimonas terrae]
MKPTRSTLDFSIQTPDERRDAEARRAKSVSRVQAETGIDDAMIDRLVEGFYDRVRQDPLIGAVFMERISDWGPHLAQMKLFWSSVALHSGVYQGRPMPKHLPLPIDARHFDRWLEIFEATATEICGPVAGHHFIVRARRIAQSLELGIANANGVLLDHGQRFVRSDTG